MKPSITKTVFKVSDFISWSRQKKLILSPEFQRRSVWKIGAKSFLIDTIARGLPIPIIIIRDKRTDLTSLETTREVIDGQQRLRAVLSFVAPKLLKDFNENTDAFTVSKAHNSEIHGKSFGQLADDVKESILDYEFNVHILPARMDDREVIQIFRRMNSTNYALKKQELRNAEWFGEFKSVAYELAEANLHKWRKWKTFTNDNIARMDEVEYVSDCIIYIVENRVAGKSNPKIDRYYREYDKTFPGSVALIKRFNYVMESIDELYEEKQGDFVFVSQKTFYTFFAYIYTLLYDKQGLKVKQSKNKILANNIKNKIYRLNDLITGRKAPKEVLDAIDRRTTNIKERNRFFQFLLNGK